MKRKNKPSIIYLEHLKKNRNIETAFSIIFLIILISILFFISNPGWWLYILLEFFGISIVVGTYLNSYYAELNNAKYIYWDKNGVYVITFMNKEVFTPWNGIKWIKKLKEIDPWAEKRGLEDFVLNKKRGYFYQYLLDQKIGEELYYEWMKYKEGWKDAK